MKRLAVSLLLLSLLFSIVGCSEAGSPSTTVTTIATTTPDTTAGNTTGTSPVDETTIPTTASSEPNTCQIGNIVFTGPNDMEIDINSDGVYQIVLTPSKAYVVATYTDVSSLDKEMLDILLYTASNGQDADRGQVADLSELSEIIAGFEATGEGYASTNTNGVNIYYIDLTFTDTWNLYTIQFLCNAQDDNWVDYLQLFSDFIDSAEYVGETPRFTDDSSGSDNQAESKDMNHPAQNEPDETDPPTQSEPEQTTPPTQDEPEETEPPKQDQPEANTPPTQSGPSVGETNALSSAEDYLLLMPFSYNGLIEQLEYEGYTHAEATYAADNCGADWYAQALEEAKDYLSLMSFSYSGLIEQLEYEGYTTAEATYAADNCGADWYEQAAKAARDYLDLMSFSRDGLIDQLEYEGFTHDQAVYGVEQNGL